MEIVAEQSLNLSDFIIQFVNSSGSSIVQEYASYKILNNLMTVIFFTVCIMILGLTTKRVKKFIEDYDLSDDGFLCASYNVLKYILFFIFCGIVLSSIIEIIGYNHYTDGMIVNDILKSIKP